MLKSVQNRFQLAEAQSRLVDLKRRRALLSALGGLPGKDIDGATFDTQQEIARLCRKLGCLCRTHPADQSQVFERRPDCPVHGGG